MVPEKQITPIRIKFSKVGDLMYISHLDLARTMQRIMLRSGIDIWYSEGFNPQPKIVFAVPLPVGVESECELMDIKINTPMSCEEIKERLERNFPEEMRVLDVYVPETKLKGISYIDYTINIYTQGEIYDLGLDILFLFREECRIIKKTKSGEKEINVSEYIKLLELIDPSDCITLHAIFEADGDRYLNPELFIQAIRQNLGILSPDSYNEHYTIMRNKMLDSNLEEFK